MTSFDWQFLRHIPQKKLLLFLGDAFLIAGGLAISKVITSHAGTNWEPLTPVNVSLLLVSFLFFFYLANLYTPLAPPHRKNKVLARIVLATCEAAAAYGVISFVFPSLSLGRGSLLLLSLFIVPASYAWRFGFERLFYRFSKPVRTLIVGAGWAGSTIGTVLNSHRHFDVIGYVDDDPAKRIKGKEALAVLGGTSDITQIADRYRASLLVLAITHEKRGTIFRSLLECKMNGIELYDMPSLYEDLTGKLPVEHVRDSWLVHASLRGVRRSLYTTKIKRILDLALSFMGLLFAMPIAMVACLAIAFESGFPVLYKQKRVGRNEREFWLVKFRSMWQGAEEVSGAVWAKRDDERVTRVGRLIRLLRIDEVSQMWNVLKGEMSFIGPRPERPEFVKELKDKIPYYSIRHTIKPGITGWAQVNYPYGACEGDALEKLQYDLYYLKNMSALLDLHTLLRTFRVVLFTQGSR